jgi:hypothetical protein
MPFWWRSDQIRSVILLLTTPSTENGGRSLSDCRFDLRPTPRLDLAKKLTPEERTRQRTGDRR